MGPEYFEFFRQRYPEKYSRLAEASRRSREDATEGVIPLDREEPAQGELSVIHSGNHDLYR